MRDVVSSGLKKNAFAAFVNILSGLNDEKKLADIQRISSERKAAIAFLSIDSTETVAVGHINQLLKDCAEKACEAAKERVAKKYQKKISGQDVKNAKGGVLSLVNQFNRSIHLLKFIAPTANLSPVSEKDFDLEIIAPQPQKEEIKTPSNMSDKEFWAEFDKGCFARDKEYEKSLSLNK